MKKLLALMWALSLVFLSSCAEEAPSADPVALANRFCDFYGMLPHGKIYSDCLAEWEDGHMSESLCTAIFGEDPDQRVGDDVAVAVWLGESPSAVCEFGILVCDSRSDAEGAAELCLGRINKLRSPLWGAADSSSAETAFVLISGDVVIYAALPDPVAARRAAEQALE